MTEPTSMKGKICVVTGANTGIGKEVARGLAGMGGTVVLACRDVAKGEAARAEIAASTGTSDMHVMPLDLGDTRSIREFARSFEERFERLDVLINNAGVSMRRRETTQDGFESTFGINHLGTFLLTNELVPLLRKSAPSRIVIVSSRMHARGKLDWDDLQFQKKFFNGFAAYNQSKLCNVLFANALAERLRGSGVTVNSLHPGAVVTDLLRRLPWIIRAIVHFSMVTPEEGAQCPLYVACSPEVQGVSGQYFRDSKQTEASPSALDKAAQERLWQTSEQLLASTVGTRG